MNGLRIRRTWRRGVARAATRLLPALALLPALVGGGALATPKGAQVVSGSAQIVQKGDLTTITAGNQSIIQYQSFSIAQNQTVRFIQPNAQSTVLNRVLGLDPSIIAGTLLANGRVYFVNPAGIYFVNGCLVNVGAIYAAAGYISNQNFLANVNRFTDLTGAVVNNGLIRGGEVALIGNQVANFGTIVAPNGLVSLVSGTDVYFTDNDGQILIQLNGGVPAAAGAGVQNSGSIQAPGGKVNLSAGDLYALAIFNNGSIKANEITVQGQGPGVVQVSGTLDASNSSGVGGTINVLGDKIALSGATLDASGATGGGTILVGGDLHGANPAVPDASQTSVSAGSVISADALASGNGGKVVVWSDLDTQFYGSITARGGPSAGNGGNVEVSGHYLDFQGTVDTLAPNGTAGTLLLDPTNLVINNSSPQNINTSTPFVPTGSPSVLTWGTLSTNLGLGNVVVTTAGSPANAGENGDITIAAASPDLASANKLTISAVGTLYINFGITNNSGGALEFSGASGIQLGANVTSTGPQTYDNPVTLTANVTLTASEVTFIGTVDSDSSSTPRNLAIDGNAAFYGAVGSIEPLQTVTVTGATDFYWDGNSGTNSVQTTGDQNYDGPVTLYADTVLDADYTGNGVVFGSTVDSDSLSTPRGLTLASNAQFNGSVGGMYPLNWLTVGGATVIPADISLSITVTGGGSIGNGYVLLNGPVTIGNGAKLNVTATGSPDDDGYVDFDDTVTVGTGATLNVTATGGSGVTYGGGDGYVYFYEALGIGAGATVNVTATGGAAGTGADGYGGDGYIYFEGAVTMGAGSSLRATATGGAGGESEEGGGDGGDGYVYFEEGVTIGNGSSLSVTATGGAGGSGGDGSDGGYGGDGYVYFEGTLGIGAGSTVNVTATGGTGGEGEVGGYGGDGYMYLEKGVTTGTGSSLTVTATGGAGSDGGYGGDGYVEFEDAVAVGNNGSSLSVTVTGGAGGTDGDGGYAWVYFDEAVAVGAGSSLNVTATGGNAGTTGDDDEGSAYGGWGYVYFYGLTIGNGSSLNVTATSGTGDDAGAVAQFLGPVAFEAGATANITAVCNGTGADSYGYVQFGYTLAEWNDPLDEETPPPTPVTIGNGALLKITSAGGPGTGTEPGDINGTFFRDTIDGDSSGGGSLTVTGNVEFDGAVGSNVLLQNVLVTGTVLFEYPDAVAPAFPPFPYSVFTNGPQNYGSGVTIGADTTLATYSTVIAFDGVVQPAGTTYNYENSGFWLTILYLTQQLPPTANLFPPPFIFPPPLGLPQPGQADVQDMAKLGVFLQPESFDEWLFEGRWFYDDTTAGLPPAKP